jgi:hypothetical protein
LVINLRSFGGYQDYVGTDVITALFLVSTHSNAIDYPDGVSPSILSLLGLRSAPL